MSLFLLRTGYNISLGRLKDIYITRYSVIYGNKSVISRIALLSELFENILNKNIITYMHDYSFVGRMVFHYFWTAVI